MEKESDAETMSNLVNASFDQWYAEQLSNLKDNSPPHLLSQFRAEFHPFDVISQRLTPPARPRRSYC
jgi:hypothetical protein